MFAGMTVSDTAVAKHNAGTGGTGSGGAVVGDLLGGLDFGGGGGSAGGGGVPGNPFGKPAAAIAPDGNPFMSAGAAAPADQVLPAWATGGDDSSALPFG